VGTFECRGKRRQKISFGQQPIEAGAGRHTLQTFPELFRMKPRIWVCEHCRNRPGTSHSHIQRVKILVVSQYYRAYVAGFHTAADQLRRKFFRAAEE
jgi:hypothetical protein